MPKLVASCFAIENSENDLKRSESIFSILQDASQIDNRKPLSSNPIPKKIIQFWDCSDSIPEDVKKCMVSWHLLREKGYSYTLFNEQSARDYISVNLNQEHLLAYDNCYHPAMQSDYFRLCYIYCTGGMYVDTDDVHTGLNIDSCFTNSKLKLQPLCFDIETNHMVSTQSFINNNNLNKNWIYYFNNNPLISGPFNPIIGYALERSTNILLNIDCSNLPEIQSTAGPGNITASVVAAHLTSMTKCSDELEVITNWEQLSTTVWSLSYRNDSRNWRISNSKKFTRVEKEYSL
jgi:hypothetical protein